MNYTTISVSSQKLNSFQLDFLVKSGFGAIGITYTRSVKSSELHIVLGQLASKNIPFSIKTNAPNYMSKPCVNCPK